ncbi:hypothetical protein SAMN00777080_2999 [Aquiflexum balticum DSM 16537]|uniref:Outer membrane protein beta-barrel domain-containing protein n=1 Tax=Aquiflexum balticum DSM 16537 TaxID=758820 RepID=A0A1W2H6X3_9BACT|nr:hypothetical protein [Aquiflexum balticum]SMD44378.1 hypothetical protein SAMN00777080_2999 [Aquiflexum balticum DSM 16537]
MNQNSTLIINLQKRIAFLIIFLGLIIAPSFGQESEFKAESEEILRHRISITLGHTHIPAGEIDGEKTFLSVPSWGMDYNFHINRKWAAGLHTDFITETFKVIDFEGNREFERERPFTLTLVGIYKPHERWSFLAGAGYELAVEENLSLLRLGIERGWELEKGWEVFATLQYDLKFGVYDSWMIGVGFSKGF